jgi:hypothetical protein
MAEQYRLGEPAVNGRAVMGANLPTVRASLPKDGRPPSAHAINAPNDKGPQDQQGRRCSEKSQQGYEIGPTLHPDARRQ